MRSKKEWIFIIAMIFSISFHSRLAHAKTVYSIARHGKPSILKAYEVDGDQIHYESDVDVSAYNEGYGAVGVSSWPSIDRLFVTYEQSNDIGMASLRTLLSEGVVDTGISNPRGIAGIVVDEEREKVYVVPRENNKLYIYNWDPNEQTLFLEMPDPNEPNDPNYLPNPRTLTHSNAMGLALDTTNNYLYVSNTSNYVDFYDLDTWTYLGQINVDRVAYDITIDNEKNYLYVGGYFSHNYLVKILLSDPNDLDELDIGAGVIGLDVDKDTGLTYLTTYNEAVEVWDTNPIFSSLGWIQTDVETAGISGPAGVCVADVDYVPPFEVDKVDDVNDCVIPRAGEEITYTISYWYNWTEEGDPNLYEFESIYIEDSLPREVDFISADPNVGYYDESSHSYVWSITPETYGDPNSIEITVEINNKVTPGGYIENAVVEIVTDINGQEYVETAEVETSICECDDNGVVWYVYTGADGEDDGTSWEDAFGTIEQALNAAFPCDEIWVAKGTYTPVEEPNLVNYVGLYGGFYGDESERYERDWSEWVVVICGDINSNDDLNKSFSDPNRMMGDNLDYVLKAHDWINWTVVDGFTIQRGRIADIYCEGSSLLIEHNHIIDSPVGVYCDEIDILGIRNNWIYVNGDGIYLTESADETIIRNNTIVDNESIGILVDSGEEPEIINCIFWDNDANDMIGCYATYSCIEEPTHFWDESDPNNPVYLGIGEGNIDDDPLFEFETSDYDYHLSSSSPCYNAGDPNLSYSYQRDIDKHMRVIDRIVDMGADEFCDPESDSDADFNDDDIVNLLDFDEFSEVWLVESSDPNWNSLYDLAGDGDIIDSNDLLLFAEDWLWMSCSKMKDIALEPPESMQMGGLGMMYEKVLFIESTLSTEQLAVKPEPTIEEQLEDAKVILEWLEEVSSEKDFFEYIDKEAWAEFVESIYEWIGKLEEAWEFD